MKFDQKKFLFLPVILFVGSVVILLFNLQQTGDVFLKDIDLKGGTLITIDTNNQIDTQFLEDELSKKYGSVFVSGLRTQIGFGASIEVGSEVSGTEVLNDVQAMGIFVNDFSIETIGPVLGELFLIQMVYILISAFVLMSVIIFIAYRNIVSSFTIVFAVLANIITTLAITSVLGIQISLAGFAGLLMLIAYSVDTNILLTSKVLNSNLENFKNNYKKALTTGLTLVATIVATMLLVLVFSSSKLLVNIAEILVIGFIVDLAYTWIFNSTILEFWVRRTSK